MSEALFWTLFLGVAAGILLVQRWGRGRERTRQEGERASREAEREQRDEAFWKSAKCVRAKVLSTYQDGMVNLKPNLRITLRVEAPEGDYEMETELHVDYTDLHRLSTGSMIDVYVDPKKRDRVVLCDPDTADMLREADKPLRE